MGIEQGGSPESEFVIKNRTKEEALNQGIESIRAMVKFKQDPDAKEQTDISFFEEEVLEKISPSENELNDYELSKNQYLYELIRAFAINSNVDPEKYGEAMEAIQHNGLDENKIINNFFIKLPDIKNTYIRIAYQSVTCEGRAIEGFKKALKLKKDIYDRNIHDARTINEIDDDLKILFDKATDSNLNFIVTYQENLEQFKSKMVF